MMIERNIIRLLLTACVILAGVCLALGQGEKQGEPSYQVSVQFVVGANEGGSRPDLPANLAGIAKELKNDFGFTSYRVAGTLLGRIGANGNYEYKSVSNIFGTESTVSTPTFLEWTISGLHGVTTDKGRGLEGAAFRMGARVPVMVARDDSGKPSVNYEQVGITAMRFGIAENTPTLIGTLSLPNTPGTVFLVLTARTAE